MVHGSSLAYFCKLCFLGTQPCPFVYGLSVATLMLILTERWVVSSETTWPTKPNICHALYRKNLLTAGLSLQF